MEFSRAAGIRGAEHAAGSPRAASPLGLPPVSGAPVHRTSSSMSKSVIRSPRGKTGLSRVGSATFLSAPSLTKIAVAFPAGSPAGVLAAGASRDGLVSLYNSTTVNSAARPFHTLRAVPRLASARYVASDHANVSVAALDWGYADTVLAVGAHGTSESASHSYVSLWDLGQLERSVSLEGARGGCAAFSKNDSSIMVTAGPAGTYQIWDVREGKKHQLTLQRQTRSLSSQTLLPSRPKAGWHAKNQYVLATVHVRGEEVCVWDVRCATTPLRVVAATQNSRFVDADWNPGKASELVVVSNHSEVSCIPIELAADKRHNSGPRVKKILRRTTGAPITPRMIRCTPSGEKLVVATAGDPETAVKFFCLKTLQQTTGAIKGTTPVRDWHFREIAGSSQVRIHTLSKTGSISSFHLTSSGEHSGVTVDREMSTGLLDHVARISSRSTDDPEGPSSPEDRPNPFLRSTREVDEGENFSYSVGSESSLTDFIFSQRLSGIRAVDSLDQGTSRSAPWTDTADAASISRHAGLTISSTGEIVHFSPSFSRAVGQSSPSVPEPPSVPHSFKSDYLGSYRQDSVPDSLDRYDLAGDEHLFREIGLLEMDDPEVPETGPMGSFQWSPEVSRAVDKCEDRKVIQTLRLRSSAVLRTSLVRQYQLGIGQPAELCSSQEFIAAACKYNARVASSQGQPEIAQIWLASHGATVFSSFLASTIARSLLVNIVRGLTFSDPGNDEIASCVACLFSCTDTSAPSPAAGRFRLSSKAVAAEYRSSIIERGLRVRKVLTLRGVRGPNPL